MDEVFCDIQNNQGRGRDYRLRLITLAVTLIILNITKTKSNNVLLYIERNKKDGSHVFPSSLTPSNTKRVNLTLRNHAPWSYIT